VHREICVAGGTERVQRLRQLKVQRRHRRL
jgi:hypothetical protein